MAITAADVNELRKKTGAGMMDCKKALTEANGDFQKAIEILRKKGAAVAAKRAEKTATEGIVLTKISEDKTKAAIVEINCETDFVANSDDFKKFANLVLETVFKNKPANPTELLEKYPNVKECLDEVMGKVGEKTEVSRFLVVELENGLIVDYIHPGSKLGVLVEFSNVGEGKAELLEIGKDTAMQVAAMKPFCIYREEVPIDTIEKEIDIYKEIARKEGKPEKILDVIAQGKIAKFYQENCLFEQAYIKDNTKTISDLIKEFNNKHNSVIKLVMFKRYHLGDENKAQ
ncbi:MAG: translation elongation factor Ts [Ignavibacteria bacterium CG2_30_36_16]|nr:elongation factor Ts [Ignavibacteria bacterium]OIP55382.1 MAG: translation elongation factor Ts [Ignavibacteria bacterium CG2_30_36_16]